LRVGLASTLARKAVSCAFDKVFFYNFLFKSRANFLDLLAAEFCGRSWAWFCGGVGGGMGDKLNLEPRDFGRNWLAGGSAKLNLASPVSCGPSFIPVPASAALLDPRRQQGEGAAPLAPWGF
jgi:hypothetical protein